MGKGTLITNDSVAGTDPDRTELSEPTFHGRMHKQNFFFELMNYS